MTPEEIDGMEAGSELRRLVAERIMDCRVKRCRDGTYALVVPGSYDRISFVTREGAWASCPNYPEDITAAWEVLTKILGECPNAFAMALMQTLYIPKGAMPHHIVSELLSHLTPLAICLAAKAALEALCSRS